jgi:hypothetical protein
MPFDLAPFTPLPISRITSSRLKAAGFWRGGKSLQVCKNSIAAFCAGTIT